MSLRTDAPFTKETLTRLRPYLPPRLLETLPDKGEWSAERCVAIQRHLAVLLDMVVTYLPRHLVRALWPAYEIHPIEPVGGEFLDGTLLFADISGFTAMSERLSTLGREGAEQITDLVNRYFSAMLEVIFSYGGDLFKFGGDALLAFFPDVEGKESVNALCAAWEMQRAMAAFHRVETSLGTFPLRMKIGMHAGAVFAARVGNEHGREFIVTGPAVNATARAESLAQAGQILVSSAVVERASSVRLQMDVAPGPDDHSIVTWMEGWGGSPSATKLPSASELIMPKDPPLVSIRRLVAALDRLTPYLPSGLLPRLAAAPAQWRSGGEHRPVTVLFANFVGASDLIVRLGKEGAAEIAHALNGYFGAMQQAVVRYGGVINKVDLYDHGDKLMVLFGAPVAHENDAERAMRAALEMQAAVADFRFELEGAPSRFVHGQRIGVSTGIVFAGQVGGAGRREYTVMGDEVNLAARLMSAAQPGEILLSNFVRRKVAPFFRLEDRGAVRLKGKRNPVPTFTVVAERARPSAVRGVRGLRSPLVGRQKEVEVLRNAVAAVRHGRGGILTLVGEAGLGKSRLAAELRSHTLAEGGVTWLEGRCLSYTQQVSYSAFTGIIHDALGIVETDNPPDIWHKLRSRAEALLPADVRRDVLPYLAHFLNLPLEGPDALRVAYLTGEALQQQVMRAVTVLLEYLARERPLVLAFDDLHWADSASLALLERCMFLTERVPLLMLLLYRSEQGGGCEVLSERAARNFSHRYTAIVLTPLDREHRQDEVLVCNLLGLDQVPPSLRALIARAEGNPFYVEEIIRMLIDQGVIKREDHHWRLAREIALEAVPDTLQGLILARLDRLVEGARRTLQLASVIGRIFRRRLLEWLAAAVALAAQIDRNLTVLQQAELVRQRAWQPEPEYAFKQAMVRDVTYESLLLRDRHTYHRMVAQSLEQDYSTRLEEVYELLAHHYSLSDDQQKALFYLIKAGDKARMAYANPEAITFYREAESLATSLARVEEQAYAAEGLGDVLFHIGEYDEAMACYERALSLRTDVRQQADLHRRRAMVYEKRGEYEAALEACAQGIALLSPQAEKSVEMARLLIIRARAYWQQGQFGEALADGHRSLAILKDTTHYREIAQAHNELGNAYVRYSHPQEAIAHLEQGLEILERIGDEHEAARIYGNLAFIYYQRDLGRSAAYLNRALETMRRLGNVWGESQALQNLGIIHYAQGDYDEAIASYEASLAIKMRLGDNLGIADCHINLGEAYRAKGDPQRAIVHLRKGVTIAREIGVEQAEAEGHRQLAECFLEVEDAESALTACEEALARAREIGDRREEGIIRRVQGDAYAQLGAMDQACDYLAQSAAILRELNQEFDLGTTLYRQGCVLAQVGQYRDARQSLREAVALFQKLGLAQEEARARSALEALVEED